VPGKFLGELESNDWAVISAINISLIFFLQGLGLKTDDMKAAMRAYKAVSYGIVAILGITGLYGFIMFHIPFSPAEFSYGAALFCTVPTTLTSGVTLVNQGNGNGVLALLLTAGTNLLGIVTTPFYLKGIFSTSNSSVEGEGQALDPTELLLKLLLTVLMPLAVGKVVRESSKRIQEFAKEYKTPITMITNFLLIMIVWMR